MAAGAAPERRPGEQVSAEPESTRDWGRAWARGSPATPGGGAAGPAPRAPGALSLRPRP